jgi:hypothetical protein
MPVTQDYKLASRFTIRELCEIQFALMGRIAQLRDAVSARKVSHESACPHIAALLVYAENAAGKVAADLNRITDGGAA